MTEPTHSSNSRLRLVLSGGLLVLAFALLAAGCGGFSNAGAGSAEQEKAQQLVSAAHAAGVAPHLTVEVAEALYGEDAAGCLRCLRGRPHDGRAQRPARQLGQPAAEDDHDECDRLRASGREDLLPRRAVALQRHRQRPEPCHVFRLGPRESESSASVAARFPSRPARLRRP